MIITIDGPSGTGKTTIAQRVAAKLAIPYFDTGAMYRSVTWWLLKHHVLASDLKQVAKVLEDFPFRAEEGQPRRYFIGEEEITAVIRSSEVTQAVSAYSALKPVRELLTQMQRAFAERGDAVFEGRDMGSVVFPEAEVKIFLTASPAIRAERRLREIYAANPQTGNVLTHDKMLADILRRDHLDTTRTLAPLVCPKGAFEIDTSTLSVDEVTEKILAHKKATLSER
jgi:cytidylate kinase